jgi:EAL domain-containing protein (putative c-di-GMP-specific phosphodiesterase class I)
MKSSNDARQRGETALRTRSTRTSCSCCTSPSIDCETARSAASRPCCAGAIRTTACCCPRASCPRPKERHHRADRPARARPGLRLRRRLRDAGFSDVPVAVNISYREYSQPDFVANTLRRLPGALPLPRRLKLDLRDRRPDAQSGPGRDLAEQLRQLGVTCRWTASAPACATSASCSSWAPGQVKLAHSPCTPHRRGPGAAAVAKSLIDIGHNLDMMVVGDAVETRAQLDFLKSHGCDQVQGRLFSEPLGADAAQQMPYSLHESGVVPAWREPKFHAQPQRCEPGSLRRDDGVITQPSLVIR